jgi:hypothetical protein
VRAPVQGVPPFSMEPVRAGDGIRYKYVSPADGMVQPFLFCFEKERPMVQQEPAARYFSEVVCTRQAAVRTNADPPHIFGP